MITVQTVKYGCLSDVACSPMQVKFYVYAMPGSVKHYHIFDTILRSFGLQLTLVNTQKVFKE